jgi:transcriptional regulator GlxA family with amidase domain
MQEVRRARVERVKELLSATNLPMTSVARLCGFKNAAFLSESFRRQIGVPPATYRRRLRAVGVEANGVPRETSGAA